MVKYWPANFLTTARDASIVSPQTPTLYSIRGNHHH